MSMIFRQLFDSKSFTYTYLLADRESREAVLVDTVYEQFQRDAALIQELGLRLVATLETHVHADHVTASWLFKERLGSRIMVGARAGTTGHDVAVDDGDQISFGSRKLDVLTTPGHTDGCVTYVLDDKSMAFTGDALLIRGAGRTDFQQGSARTLYHSVRDKIFALPDSTLVYPGHDYSGRTVTSIGEEKRLNPRLGGERSEEDFVGFMSNLNLAHPKQIQVAVPANRKCGRPEISPRGPLSDWAPVTRTFAGVPEIGNDWLSEHRRDVRVIDVREPAEFDGELGHIEGAELVPLGKLTSEASTWDKATKVVTVCRSGGRSAQAAVLLESAGFSHVANLSGGMIAWRSAGHPVAKA